jgi:hypothetical protein
MPSVWMEARCDNNHADKQPLDYLARSKCLETSKGMFASRISQMNVSLRRQGWKLIDGEWVCSVCAEHIAEKEVKSK